MITLDNKQKTIISGEGIKILDKMPGNNEECSTADMDISNEICCGTSVFEPSDPFEKAGFKILSFVKGFHNHNGIGFPVIKNKMELMDSTGTFFTRIGINRNNYKVPPGLYCSGKPDENSEVFVSANYKISFDHLRKSLNDVNAWILVIDTMGVNVWCAAGKKTFSTGEIAHRIKKVNLDSIVNHRRIVVPQLGAPGVSSFKVKKVTGFEVIWGPVYTKDIPEFIENEYKTKEKMRKVKFDLPDRAVLIPVEISIALKPALFVSLFLFLISGFGPDFFSFERMVSRGMTATLFFLLGVFSGGVLTPLLLPFLPTRIFSFKGFTAGFLLALCFLAPLLNTFNYLEIISILLFSATSGAYLAMNFTGSTPYTSPSGVEKEMKAALPLQITAAIAAVLLWIISAFIKGV